MGKGAHRLEIVMSDAMLKKIECLLEGVSLKTLLVSSQKMSSAYRTLGKRSTSDEEEILAYLATRMPATYAALQRVFQEIQERLGSFEPVSLMDVGSGPGTTLWAAADFFPKLKEIHCIEKEAQFLSMAKRLAEDLWVTPYVRWMHTDMRKKIPEKVCDLVIASYSLGELDENERIGVEEKLWELTKKILIVIEPGTPKGFASVRAMRKRLLNAGAYLVGPCPQAQECPMKDGDWCHFYARLNRSSLHRKVKGAELNYEDEKFSYMAFSKDPVDLCSSRIIRHPRKGKGHVQLTLCTAEDIEDTVITKKERALYQLAKKNQWGDSLQKP
jgi:ribosomal protein RSM22 (predicted rRNA methylase)